MLVKYREPWHITQNRVYGFTDVKTADTMQYDYTFYIDYELKKSIHSIPKPSKTNGNQ